MDYCTNIVLKLKETKKSTNINYNFFLKSRAAPMLIRDFIYTISCNGRYVVSILTMYLKAPREILYLTLSFWVGYLIHLCLLYWFVLFKLSGFVLFKWSIFVLFKLFGFVLFKWFRFVLFKLSGLVCLNYPDLYCLNYPDLYCLNYPDLYCSNDLDL